jgi:hypothetical protein
MKLSRCLRILFAVALLNAQHAALAHQIWHLGDKGTQPAQSEFCGHHNALGTAAGALDSPAAFLACDTPAGISIDSISLPSAATPGLAPTARGPPSLL